MLIMVDKMDGTCMGLSDIVELPDRCLSLYICSVHFSCSVMSDSLLTPWTVAPQASLSITNSQRFLKLPICVLLIK